MCRSGGGAAAKATPASGEACTVCGKTNHVKADCKLKDKVVLHLLGASRGQVANRFKASKR